MTPQPIYTPAKIASLEYHLLLTLRGLIQSSPEEIALGTFGEYDMGAVQNFGSCQTSWQGA